MGLQNASSWKLRQPNELYNGRNLRFNKEIGAAIRRNGYIPSGDVFSASGKTPVGLHTAQFTTGAKKFVAVPAEDNSSTLVKVQETNGSWTTVISSIPAGADVYFTDYRDEVYVSGYTVADGVPFQPYNIDKTLNVSVTRNLLFAPWAKYYVVYRGVLYAANVRVDGTNYPDRFYKGSAPTGAITFIRGDQDNPTVAATLYDQVPVMTSNTTPSGVAASSSVFDASFNPYLAFDGNLTLNNKWVAANATTTGWISYDFGSGVTKTITHYSMVAVPSNESGVTGRAPNSWTFEGSNNGSSWTTLHTVTGQTAWGQGEKRNFVTTNTVAYRYYRINVTAINGGDVLAITELEFLASTINTTTFDFKIDSARYIKPGMMIDVYTPKGVKQATITVATTDKNLNTMQFLPTSYTITSANTTTDEITISSTTDFDTGKQVRFQTAGTLPAPLATQTTYYAIKTSSTTMKLATTYENSLNGTAIDLTTAGSGTSLAAVGYSFKNNDELWLTGRKDLLTTFWNTDYPTPDKADWSAVQPGADSSIAITAAKESANRLFVFTENSASRFDGTNTVPFSKTIGCVSQRTLVNMDDDWLLWLTPRGRVYARNESASQQEYISRGMYNQFFSKLSLTQLRAASAGATDNEFYLYVGDVDGEPSRAVYDFGSNTWSVDALNHKSYMYTNGVADGVIKPFFVSDGGKLYQDDTGDMDDDKVPRFQMDLGKTNYGGRNEKYYLGHYIDSEFAIGMKIVISIDGGEPMVVGEITKDHGNIMYNMGDNKERYRGSSVAVSLKSAVAGPPQKIISVDDYYNVIEEVNASGKKQYQ